MKEKTVSHATAVWEHYKPWLLTNGARVAYLCSPHPDIHAHSEAHKDPLNNIAVEVFIHLHNHHPFWEVQVYPSLYETKMFFDCAQAVMENILCRIDDSDIYIDDVGAFSMSWESHLELLCIVLQQLKDDGITVKPSNANGLSRK